MAIYVPAGRRQRRAVFLATATLALGLILGGVAGRATAPSLAERVRSTQHKAAAVSAQLRVLSLHQEANAASLTAGEGGTTFALRRARSDLSAASGAAPWITAATRQRLLAALDRLLADAANPDNADFARAVEATAADIDAAFGLSTPTRTAR